MSILVVDDLHPVFFEMLTRAGIAVDYRPEITANEVREQIGTIQGLVVRSKLFLDQETLQRARHLRFIARAGSGMDNIDEAAAAELGITLINVPEANANAVAEHALGLLLASLRNIAKSFNEIRGGTWLREQNRGVELPGLKVGIIGYGHTGSGFARKLALLGCEVLAYDKYKSGFGEPSIRECTIEEICREARVISFHVPLTAETRHYFNTVFIEACAHNILLINTSRGAVVDTKALSEGLFSGRISAAALDVLENEKLDTLSSDEFQIHSNLLNNPHVLITSHIAGWTVESYRKIAVQLAVKISGLLRPEI